MNSQPSSHKSILRLVQMAMLVAISIVLVMLIRFPIFPSAPFLVYDMADVPVLIGTLLFGPWHGLLILLIESALQAMALSADGIVGFLMHFLASGLLVLAAGLLYRKYPTVKGMIAGLSLGSVLRTLMMIPLNFIFTVHFYGVPIDAVKELMLPAIIPFNVIISVTNSLITFFIFIPVRKYLRKGKQL